MERYYISLIPSHGRPFPSLPFRICIKWRTERHCTGRRASQVLQDPRREYSTRRRSRTRSPISYRWKTRKRPHQTRWRWYFRREDGRRGRRLLARASFSVRSVSFIVPLNRVRPQLPCPIHMLWVRVVALRETVGGVFELTPGTAYRYIGSFGVYQAFYVRQYLHTFSTSDIG